MSDLVVNPEDRFSRVAAHIIVGCFGDMVYNFSFFLTKMGYKI